MTRSRRILILYWDIGLGGVQKKICDIVTKLYKEMANKNKKIEVTILLNHKNYQGLSEDLYYRQLKELGVTIKFDPGWKWRSIGFPYTLHALWRTLVDKPDILLSFLHRHGIISVICKLTLFWRKIRVLYGQDIVLSESLRAIYKGSHKIPRRWKLLVKIFFPFIDLTIAPTNFIKMDLVGNFRLPRRKIKVIHNWVLNFGVRKTRRARYDLVYLGRISRQKRLDRLVSIIENIKLKLPGISVAIVGDGEEAGNLAYMILRRNLYANLHLLGASADPDSYFESAKIFVLTSDYEGEPIALLEAMGMGMPVVVSNYNGVTEVVRDGFNGFICTSDQQFADRILAVLHNHKLAMKLGGNSLQTVKRKFGKNNLNKFTSLLLAGDP